MTDSDSYEPEVKISEYLCFVCFNNLFDLDRSAILK